MLVITHDYSGYKLIDYFGNKLLVPHWTRFVATDPDGCINAFSKKPYYESNAIINAWLLVDPSTQYETIAKCTFDIDPNTTLIEV